MTVPAVGAGAIAVDLAWSLLGFYLHAAMFAAGATLVSRQEEIASVTAPPILLSCLLVNVVMLDPGSTTSTVLSLLPPFAPVLVTARLAAGDPPAWQVLLAVALTFATAGGMTWVAGRIYANSVLRVGARERVMDPLRGKSACARGAAGPNPCLRP